ncbi:MAG: arylsulfatase [Phycisphaerales bacterium]|nr:arylsulfatase [Phycisphaerales bacterium]
MLIPLTCILSASLPVSVPPSEQPNIVVVLADDLGWGEIGCQGQKKIPTPHIDSIAQGGMRLTDFWSGSPVCAPSRCVLLTGKHPGHAVVRNNWENGGWEEGAAEGQYPLPAEEVTIAEVLKDRGYDTCVIGKWGLGGPETEGHPNQQGFDHWFGYLCQRQAHNYYPTHLWRNADKVMLEGNDWFASHQKRSEPLSDEQSYYDTYQRATYASDLMRDEAVEWINTRDEEPFFLYYASPIPHVALQIPEERLDQFPREWDQDHYLGQKGYVPHPRPRAAYAAMIAGLDTEIGSLMRALEEGGHADNTLVIITSDNGPTYAGGVDYDFFDSNGPYRGLKGSVFEGGLRVPMVVRWPGKVAPGTTSEVPGGFEDLMPTLTEVTGERVESDGRSLVDVLTNQASTIDRPWLYRELGGQQAVRWGKWKGVRRHLRKGDLKIELFDLASDPGETTDVSTQHPEVTETIEAIMSTAHQPSEIFPLPAVDKPVKKQQSS